MQETATYITTNVQTARREGRSFYRPELDVLRFFAFMLVFIHHAPDLFAFHAAANSFTEACGSGLQLFFLLSSYLITELLLRERETTGRIHLRAFFTRRILRIWPLYFLFVGTCFAISTVSHNTIITREQFAYFVLLAGNWWVVLHGFMGTIIGPLWSISIEEQYYLTWPFIAHFGSKRALWSASVLSLVIASGTLAYLGGEHVRRNALWANSLVQFAFFAAGAVLALLLHQVNYRLSTSARCVIFVAGAVAILLAQTVFGVMADEPVGSASLLLGYAALTIGVAAIFLAFFGITLPKSVGPLIYLGKISYGLYVFHFLTIRIVFRALQHHNGVVFGLLKMAVALALCIALAMLSYRFIEQPFLRLKQRFTYVRNRVD